MEKLKSTKWIALPVVVLLVLTVFRFSAPKTKTFELQPVTLEEVITATGRVESCNIFEIKSSVNAEVTRVIPAVGDIVQKGDVIIRLDNSDILSDIAKEKEKLAENKQKALKKAEAAQLARDTAKENLEELEDELATFEDSVTSAYTAMTQAKADFDIAVKAIQPEQSAYDTALKEEEKAREKYSQWEREILALKTEMENAEKEKDKAEEKLLQATEEKLQADTEYEAALDMAVNAGSDPDITQEEAEEITDNLWKAEENQKYKHEKLTEAENNLDTATQNYENAKTNYESAGRATFRKELVTAKEETDRLKLILDTEKELVAYNSLEKEYDKLKEDYEDAVEKYDKKSQSMQTREDKYILKKEAYETSLEKLEEYDTSEELEKLNKELKEYIIKSPTNGIVTEINTANEVMAVIKDNKNLKVIASFTEADVQKLSTGMDCRINESINGKISKISPVTENNLYKAEITIDTDHNLTLDTDVEIVISIAKYENIYAVPTEAIGTDSRGKSIVHIKNKNTFIPTEVTTGVTINNLTRISAPTLTSGALIKIPDKT